MVEQFEQGAEYFQSVILSSPDFIRIIGLDGRVEFVNPSSLKTLIDSGHSPLGKYWPDMWPDEEDRERVFQPLARVDESVEGSGIGLATCRRILEAHGGTIGLEASPTGGTCAWFELPVPE